MNARTLKALRGSIKKWEAIVAGTDIDEGLKNCPLCVEFWSALGECGGCPVKSATGHPYCRGTPYNSWADAHNEAGRDISLHVEHAIHDDDTAIAAVLELEFLRSLLPGAK